MPIVATPSTAEGSPIYVELDLADAKDDLGSIYGKVETRDRAVEKVIGLSRDVFAEGIDLARRCAERAAQMLKDSTTDLAPDEMELQLAIRLDSEVGAVLVKAGAEAQLQLCFRWKSKDTA
jgi:hypothetical protein